VKKIDSGPPNPSRRQRWLSPQWEAREEHAWMWNDGKLTI